MRKVIKFFIIFALVFVYIGTLNAAEYVAFSLKVAQERIISTPEGKDYRKLHPEVFTIGGITAIKGLVYDRKTGDVILVGQRDPERSILTIDDFVVALRARFIHGKWPLVSIDPTPETQKTNMQRVRFEGGIQDTQFGQDLFDADYRLKKIGMGLMSPGVPGFKTYWDLSIERAKDTTGGNQKINSRFWFYPVLPSVSVREDVVAIKGLKVGVFTEVLSAEIDGRIIEDLSTFEDVAGDEFAKGVSDKFEQLARAHGSFSRLQGLDELVALTKAIEDMDEKPDLFFWLRDYRVKEMETKKEVEILTRVEEFEVRRDDSIYKSYCEVSGGVELMAIALRLKAGDVTALKEAVLRTRPKPGSLSWSFIVAEWLIPTSPEMSKMEDIVPLFTQAVFLQRKKYYDDAITLYGKIIELKPDWDWAYNNRGLAYHNKGEYDRAISDYNRAIQINPRYAYAYGNRGNVYAKKEQYDKAIFDYNKAIEIDPRLAKSYNNRGAAYDDKGEYDRALSDYNRAIQINPRYAKAYNNRGLTYARGKNQYDSAISDFNKALEINPRYAEAYNNRGLTYDHKGQYDQAISDYNKAIEINPRYAEAYNNRGAAYDKKGQYGQAISDYNKAIEINPRDAGAYYNRGNAYCTRGDYELAISDYNKAIEINPRDAGAYYNRGNAYCTRGDYELAISDYNKALEINPRLVEVYYNRGTAYYLKGEYEKAWKDVYRAQDLGCQVHPGFLRALRQALGRQR